MFDNLKRNLPPRPQASVDTQVLRSMQGQSAISLDQNESEQLFMKVLMLSIEIDRKDAIVKELLQLVSGDETRRVIEELNIKCSKYQMQVKSLRETVAMLKENISMIQSQKNREMFTSMTQFNEELENKVSLLEVKLRKTQEEKIDLEEQVSRSKMQQTVEGYKSLQQEHFQKNRIRELEGMLATERARCETERKVIHEKNLLLEEYKSRVSQIETREKIIISQFEQKLRSVQNQMVFHQNMKKSQIVQTEQRLTMTSQQVTSLNDQIRTLKNANEQLKDTVQHRERDMNSMNTQIRTVETRLVETRNQLHMLKQRFDDVNHELKVKDREIGEKANLAQKLTREIEEIRFIFSSKGEEAHLYSQELQRARTDIIQLEKQIKNQNAQIRKLRRKPPVLCEGCHARELGSSTIISSQKSMKGLNFDDIINQTEQVFRSNKRVESMISRHDSAIESSIHLFRSRAAQM